MAGKIAGGAGGRVPGAGGRMRGSGNRQVVKSSRTSPVFSAEKRISAGYLRRDIDAGAPSYSPSDISRLEKAALDRANKAVSAIENAIALWDASPQKPQDVELRMGRLRHFYSEITKWEREMLKSAGRKRDMVARIMMLRRYSDICHASA